MNSPNPCSPPENDLPGGTAVSSNRDLGPCCRALSRGFCRTHFIHKNQFTTTGPLAFVRSINFSLPCGKLSYFALKISSKMRESKPARLVPTAQGAAGPRACWLSWSRALGHQARLPGPRAHLHFSTETDQQTSLLCSFSEEYLIDDCLFISFSC